MFLTIVTFQAMEIVASWPWGKCLTVRQIMRHCIIPIGRGQADGCGAEFAGEAKKATRNIFSIQPFCILHYELATILIAQPWPLEIIQCLTFCLTASKGVRHGFLNSQALATARVASLPVSSLSQNLTPPCSQVLVVHKLRTLRLIPPLRFWDK